MFIWNAPVTANAGYWLSGGVISSDCCWKSIAHCSVSAGEKKLLVFLIMEGLVAPYHMLSYVNCYCGSVCKSVA